MKNILYGIYSMIKKPSKIIGFGITALISYIGYLYFKDPSLKLVIVILPIPVYLLYIGHTYLWHKATNDVCSYDNYQNISYNQIPQPQISHIEKKTTNTVTNTETIYFKNSHLVDIDEERY